MSKAKAVIPQAKRKFSVASSKLFWLLLNSKSKYLETLSEGSLYRTEIFQVVHN
jgi:hypothetical protein